MTDDDTKPRALDPNVPKGADDRPNPRIAALAISRQDAIAAIVSRTPLTAKEIEGFLACSDDERAELIAAYRDAEKMPSRSAWDVFLNGLKLCAELAGYVAPIEGVLAAVFGAL